MHGDNTIAGVDEAGRGPLAGPVVAAAVVLDPKKWIEGLADSKILTEKKREELFFLIRSNARAWSVGIASVQEIEQHNILQASLIAMQRAVGGLSVTPTLALIDGNRCPKLHCRAEAIIGGDATERAISAASIVAKVIRDRMMKMFDKKYPLYGFGKHKGYATEMHVAALQTHGLTLIHRKTFAPVKELLGLNKK